VAKSAMPKYFISTSFEVNKNRSGKFYQLADRKEHFYQMDKKKVLFSAR